MPKKESIYDIMKRKMLCILFIVLIGVIVLCYYIQINSKIELSSDVVKAIDLYELSLHVDDLIQNGFIFSKHGEYNKYILNLPQLDVVFLVKHNIVNNNSQFETQYSIKRIDYQEDHTIYIHIRNSYYSLFIWLDNNTRSFDSKYINNMIYNLFTNFVIIH